MTTAPASLAWSAAAITTHLPTRTRRPRGTTAEGRGRGQRGEGVISVAIAVLIIAFLAALMWVGFRSMWDRTETRTNQQVDHIGNG